MFRPPAAAIQPLPEDFLRWQVELRRHTMEVAQGTPHVGVAPLLTIRRPGAELGVSTHAIICGVLPHPHHLETKTAAFREVYERHVEAGAKAVYDAGIEYLRGYYRDPAEFDPDSLTTLVSESSDLTAALAATPRAKLLFYVFQLAERSFLGRFRCVEIDCAVELHREGPVYDNVWWHNSLFHGKMDDSVVLRFRHLASFDTAFGRYERLVGG